MNSLSLASRLDTSATIGAAASVTAPSDHNPALLTVIFTIPRLTINFPDIDSARSCRTTRPPPRIHYFSLFIYYECEPVRFLWNLLITCWFVQLIYFIQSIHICNGSFQFPVRTIYFHFNVSNLTTFQTTRIITGNWKLETFITGN